MRRIAFATALLAAGLAGGASAQGISSNGVIYGQNWNLPQDLSTLQGMQGSGLAADRAARAARQAQFNQHFPGTPTGSTGARRDVQVAPPRR